MDYHNGDGTIWRRDPTKVIKANGKYYVWYTRRHTETPPRGAQDATDVIPSTDWDLAEIWYATSKNGFLWQEQGVAVPRPPKPFAGWPSVSTPDVLVWKEKYYLYYQGFLQTSGTRGDDCPVTVSFTVASSVSLMPIAPGPYVPDAFTNTSDGRGITWGLCHFTTAGTRETRHSILARFDCDLSLDDHNPWMKDPEHYWPPEYYFRSGLGKDARRKLENLAREDLKK
ncbi:MAG: hypothetical protein JW741_17280 [Sedimentisphaerales bacterium]|nr:hypothetical protein [Sedimentisphaerales bacterium]